MASSSSRYQSKLFNVFSQSLSQLAKLQPHLRRLKARAVWGAQVLFYMASGLMQTGFGRKDSQHLAAGADVIDAAIAPSSSRSIAHSAEPIQQILRVVETLCLSPSQTDSMAASSQFTTLPVQGVATQLMTRTLVLVTAQNEVLDLLSPQQQKRLHQRIIWEVVSYGFHRRLTQITRRLGRPKPPKVFPALFAQKRLLGVPSFDNLRQRLQKLWLSPHPIPRQFLKGILARNSGALAQPVQRTSGLAITLRPVGTMLRLSYQTGRELLWSGLANVRGELWRQPPTTTHQAAATDELTIRALIRAAISYFFGRSPWKLGFQSTSAQLDSSNPTSALAAELQESFQGDRDTQTADPKKKLLNSSQPEPWLTLADLFGGATLELTGYGAGATSSNRTARSPKEVTQTQASVQPCPTADGDSLDIEAEAVSIGYVKHPLERVLDWLDRTIAWLEGILATFQHYLRLSVVAPLRLIRRRQP